MRAPEVVRLAAEPAGFLKGEAHDLSLTLCALVSAASGCSASASVKPPFGETRWKRAQVLGGEWRLRG